MHQFTIHPSSHHPSSNFQHAKNLRKESAKICEKLIITSPHHHIIPSSNFQLPACKKSAKICEKLITTSPHHPSSNFQHAKNLRETHHHIITSPHHPIIQLPACKKSARNSSPHHHIITSPHSSSSPVSHPQNSQE